MTNRIPLKRVALLRYGDSLPAESRRDGKIPVIGSGGISGTHDVRNALGPAIVVGRKGSYGTIYWAPAGCFAIDTAYTIDQRTSTVDMRWLFYALSAVDLQGISQDVGVPGLSREAAHSVLIPEPPPYEEQWRIAEFLDVETSRIEFVAGKLRRLEALLQVRKWSVFDQLISRLDVRFLPVRRLLRSITDGPFGSAFLSSDYSDSGAAVVRLGNIGFDEYRSADQARIPLAIYRKFLRHRVRSGDLLIAGLGDTNNHAGRACVAPDLGPAMVKGKCFCARIDTGITVASYLALLLSSPIGEQAFVSRGSTRSMINLELVKSAVVPVPSVSDQVDLLEAFDSERSTTQGGLEMIDRQSSLLVERRQALITAAVTGQIDVTTARGAEL